jgi:hypothetical protein
MTSNRLKTILLVIGLMFMVRDADADTIYLKNGRTIRAENVRVEGNQVTYRKYGAVVRYPVDQVARIERGPGPVEPVPSRETDASPTRESGPGGEGKGLMESVRSYFTPDPRTSSERYRRTGGGPVTIQSLIRRLESVPPPVLTGIFAAPVLLVWLMGVFISQGRARKNPWRYLYSVFVYLVSAPGMLACVLIAYSLFFLRQNLLQVNVFVYFLPILSMIVTLALIARKVSWRYLPGVDRLYALMIALIITFGGILAIQKTRIFIGFFGSFKTLIVIAVIGFILLKWSLRKVIGPR